MSFDEDAMDVAYKSLESTESFCELSSKKFSLFSNSSSSSSSSSSREQQLSPHEKLYRRAIIADCILFEAILVFLKQGLTSYVKGGYLLRKSYKMYQKIFEETEALCKLASPISRPGMVSPTDRHVGTSLYDKETPAKVTSELEEEEEEEADGLPEASLAEEVGENLSSLHIGFSGFGANSPLSNGGGEDNTDPSGGKKWRRGRISKALGETLQHCFFHLGGDLQATASGSSDLADGGGDLQVSQFLACFYFT